MSHVRPSCVCGVLALAIVATGALADDLRATLVVILPAECPTEGTFRAQVAAELGRDPFVAVGVTKIVLTTDVNEDVRTVHVDVFDGGRALGHRDLEGPADTCDELTAQAALAVAAFLEPVPRASPQLDSPAPAPLPSTPPPEEAPRTVDAPGPLPATPLPPPLAWPALRLQWRGVLDARVGRQPGVALGARMGLAVRAPVRLGPLHDAALGLEVRATLPSAADLAVGQVQAQELALALVPCARWGLFDLCGVVDGGALFAAGTGLDGASAGALPAAAAGARVAFTLPVLYVFGIDVHIDALVPITHHRLNTRAPVTVAWETWPVAFALGLGGAFPDLPDMPCDRSPQGM